MVPLGWQQQPEICIDFDRMPISMGARDIWRALSEFGTISAITIHEDPEGNSRGKGFVRFSPPPREPFWEKPLEVLWNGRKARVALWAKPHREQVLPGLINTEHQYPAVLQIEARGFHVGVLVRSDGMLDCWSTLPFPANISAAAKRGEIFRHRPITVAQNLEFRELQITFPVHFRDGRDVANGVNRTDVLRLVIPLQQRIKVFKSHLLRGSATEVLVFSVESPPSCFRRGDEGQSLDRNVHRWNENESLFRQVDVVLDPRSPRIRRKPTSLRQDHSIINLGQWTCYAIEIHSQTDPQQFEQFCDCLKDHNIEIRELQDFDFIRTRPARVWDYIDPPGTNSFDEHASYSLSIMSDASPLDFSVRYQLEVCISGGWFNEYDLGKDFVQKLRSMPAMEACALLELVATDRSEQKNRRLVNPLSIFETHTPQPSVLNKRRPDWCAMIRSAVVTPTTVIVNTPSCEISNRVIRHYIEHADRFLRVRFLDEKHRGRIYSSVGKNNMNEVFTRIFRTMTNGITIGSRHYEFLAFGNSQFRDNGAYFFSPISTLDSARIRQWMGSFDHIKVVAKYAARLGQCFSTTRAMKSVKPRIREIDDVVKNGFNFTDGVGKISPNLARIASQDFKIPMKNGEPPSIFQFRLGGAKGILTVWPDVKPLELCIRDSQNKFKAMKDDLEIIRWSQASEFSLNRQLIVVLSALGVPDVTFNRKAQSQLQRINIAMEDERIAKEALNSSVDVNGITLALSGMVSDGFHAAREPFMMTMMNLWRAWSIKFLKEKAKIHIPQGAVLLGCTDETQTLKGHCNKDQHKLRSKSGHERLDAVPEVFVQVSNFQGSGHSRIIEGLMIIARNPSLHAGDIRVVKGVRCPALSHLKDCLVLPQTGDRDVSNMCSGGDLDGDDYIVSWDQELIPVEWNHQPMDFTPPEPKIKESGVTIEDITGFFVQYMKNADLGNIAYSHLATADHEVMGVKSQKCLELAKIHSDAVDYPKTGQPANIPDRLRPRRYPHFMERKRGCYHSKKILGQLYDSVKLVDFNPSYDNAFDNRIIDAYQCTEEHLTCARELKIQYDTAIRRVMAQHGLATEFEAWSAFALERNKTYGDFKFGEVLGESMLALKEQYCELCIQHAGSREIEELSPFVAAMYTVTCQEMRAALEECETSIWDQSGLQRPQRPKDPQHMPLMSFPWLFPVVLGRIAKRQAFRAMLNPQSATTDPLTATARKPDAPSMSQDSQSPELFETKPHPDLSNKKQLTAVSVIDPALRPISTVQTSVGRDLTQLALPVEVIEVPSSDATMNTFVSPGNSLTGLSFDGHSFDVSLNSNGASNSLTQGESNLDSGRVINTAYRTMTPLENSVSNIGGAQDTQNISHNHEHREGDEADDEEEKEEGEQEEEEQEQEVEGEGEGDAINISTLKTSNKLSAMEKLRLLYG